MRFNPILQTKELSLGPAMRASTSKLVRRLICAVTAALALVGTVHAAIPGAEKLLPDDTLLLVTTPDYAKLSNVAQASPQAQLWSDPAMRAFKEKFVSKWNEEFVRPLERDLDVKLSNYVSLLQGQVTIAVVQNGWQGEADKEPALLLLVDAKDKSDQLKKNLSELRKKWVDAGKTLRTEKVREVEFTILPFTTNDTPQTLKKLFPGSAATQESGAEKETKKAPSKDELFVGQVGSLLIVGTALKAVEKVVVHATGGSIPALGDQAAYQANHMALFRESPVYAWANAKVFLDIIARVAEEKKENADAPNPFDFKPDKVLAALGVSGLKTVAVNVQNTGDGALAQIFLGVPESSRQGLFKIIAGEPKESNPPPFVPADATKFQRWRIDCQKAWATVQKMLGDLSPQAVSVLNFMLDTANTAAKDKDPSFDIRKNLFGNLGDDIITLEKAPRGKSASELQSPPSLFLLSSPNAEQLAGSFKSVLVYLAQQSGGSPDEREFLGHKIYSVPMPAMNLPGSGGSTSSARQTLNYAASKGYVAMSTDTSLVEEFLRSSESQAKALRELPGLAEAAQKVTGPGTSLFGYGNGVESTRALFESLRKDSGSSSNVTGSSLVAMLPNLLAMAGGSQDFKDWFDFSLLPSFDKVSKYFYFNVYSGSANADGIRFKFFAPTPPQLKAAGAGK